LRLQALLAERAAELGLEMVDVTDLVRLQPALGPLLGTGDLEHLAQLRLLWRHRSAWPRWLERAESIFDVARTRAAEKVLAERPDLLMLVRNAPIHIGTRGVWIKDACLTHLPPQVEVMAQRHAGGEGYEIIAGGQRVWFTSDPRGIADDLEDWLHFYFRDFLPQTAAEHARPSTAAGAKLRRGNAVPCPECSQPVVPLSGDVGLRADGDV